MADVLAQIPIRQSRVRFLDYFKSHVYFNAPLDGRAIDRGPSRLALSVSGALPSNGDSFGRSCYWFDGTNDRVDCGANAIIPYGSHSVFVWALPTKTTDASRIIEHSRGTTSIYLALTWAGTTSRFAVSAYGSAGWTTVTLPGGRIGAWSLISYSYNHAATITRCFLNGMFAGSMTNSRTTGFSGSFNTWIGGNANNTDPTYQWGGKIADFGVLSRPTSDQEHLDYFRSSGYPTKKNLHSACLEAAPGASPIPVFMNHYREMGIC